jgi:lycopene beta-cyclase
VIESRYDLIIVGGGLAGGLCALALRQRRPRLRVALIEAGPRPGGNHTWSFHDSDVDEEGAALLRPLVVARWPRVEVAFPDHRRTLATGYATITGGSFARAVEAAFAESGSWQLLTGRKVIEIGRHTVVLDGGARLHGDLVLDARGPQPATVWAENQGWQKFLGLEVEVPVAAPVDPDTALIMDATVEQQSGFRFVYLLPLAPGRLLVEDTCYSDDPTLERPRLRQRALAYLQARGIEVRRVLREEEGQLPISWSDDSVPALGWPLRLGARGGWVHPTTGYTLPLAARVATCLASNGPAAGPPALLGLQRQLRTQARFCRRLNRLLFRAVAPSDRWQVLSRFYRLGQGTIERFYALRTSAADRARILLGRPPAGLSLPAAWSALHTV